MSATFKRKRTPGNTPGIVDPSTSALETCAISKAFGGLEVLLSVGMSVRQGEICGIVGPNGAGKTTLLNIISGITEPDSGEILLGGRSATGMTPVELARAGLARTYQNIRLFRGLTVREQVRAGNYRRTKVGTLRGTFGSPAARREERESDEWVDEVLQRVGLSDRSELLAENLDYGGQRRTELARALASRPRILLLDEPTAGMNANDWSGIAELVCALRDEGMTIVMVEHNMRLVEAICNRVVVVAAGSVIAEGEPREVLRSSEVVQAYFGK